jgi:hypothetical protein
MAAGTRRGGKQRYPLAETATRTGVSILNDRITVGELIPAGVDHWPKG